MLVKEHEEKKGVDGHFADILAVVASDDEALLASSGKDRKIKIWDLRSNKLVHTFKGHKDTVSCLAFRKESKQLFSGSYDRTVKIWNCEQMAYVESLFGHQAEIQSVDSLYRDRALSAGCDKTIRSWKVVEETQLLFRGAHDYSIDVISMVNEESWASGGQDGILGLWSMNKKKPAQLCRRAHGKNNWISSVAALPFTDIVASGSCDGHLRLWKCSPDEKKEKLRPIGTIPIKGFINGIKFASDARFMVAAVGNEHRLGRWAANTGGKNSIQIIKLGENLMKKKRKLSESEAMESKEEIDDDTVSWPVN